MFSKRINSSFEGAELTNNCVGVIIMRNICKNWIGEFWWCLTLWLFIILLVRFGLLSDHLLGNSCPLGWPFVLTIFCLLEIWLFSIWFLRAGFAFWLLQFLWIAFSLLFVNTATSFKGLRTIIVTEWPP